MPIYHQLTATTPDNPEFEIRPSHWNSDHSVSLVGSEVSGAFSNAGNVSFGLETNGYLTASANVTAAPSPVNVTGNGSSVNAQTIAFTNANGITLGVSTAANGATITGSHNGLTTQTVQTQGMVSVQGSTGGVSFGNANGITFGGNASTITASHNALTSQSNQAISAANGSFAFQTVNFSNANGVSFITSAGSAIAASVETSYAASNHSHGNPTLALTNLSGTTASNSAGLTLSLSAAAPGGAANATNYFTGNTTQGSSGTMALSSQIVRGYGIVSVGQSNGSLLISSPDPVTITEMSVGISGGNTAGNSGTVAGGRVVFAGTNNITLSGSTNGSSMSISVSGPTLTQYFSNTATTFNGTNASASITFNTAGLRIDLSAAAGGGGGNFSAGVSTGGNTAGATGISGSQMVLVGSGVVSLSQTTGANGNTISILAPATSSLVGAGNVSISTDGSTITISGGTASPSPIIFSAGTSSASISSVVFSNSNGVSFGLNGSTITASHNGLTTAALSDHSHGNPTLALTNLSGTTASNSAGLTLSLSAAAPGGGVTPAVEGSNGSYTFSTLSFSNANGMSFGTSAGSAMTASYTVPSVTQYFSNTATTFNGANISGSMTLNTNGLQMSMSVAAPGAAAENNAINLLGANTAGNTTATGSTIGWSGQNVTLSGTNGSQIVISAPATSSLSATGLLSISTNGSTISMGVPAGTATMWQPFNEALNVAGQQGQGILHLVPLPTPVPAALGELHVDRLCLPLIISNSSNSTGSVTISHSLGLYTKNASTLSLVASTSYTAAATFSGTVNNSTFAGLRLHTVPWTTTIGDGRYYVAQWSRTTTAGGNCTVNQWLASQANSVYSGIFGVNSNRSYQYPLGFGAYSVSFSTAMPSAIELSQIDGTASIVARPPSFFMINGTV